MPCECENHLDLFGPYKELQRFFDENRVSPNIGQKRRLVNQNILTSDNLRNYLMKGHTLG